MAALLNILLWGSLKLLFVVLAVLYAGLVLTSYRIDGPGYQLRLVRGHPTRAAEIFLVWLGVNVFAALLRVAKSALDVLSEASAEVGEWYLNRHEVKEYSRVRSRFLL